MVSPVQPRAMSIDEVARDLNVSRSLILSSIKRGELKSARLGDRILIPRSAIERLLDGGKEPIAPATDAE